MTGSYLLPFGLSRAWVNAEAATDFSAFELLGLLRILDAFDATVGLVFSFFAMAADRVRGQFRAQKHIPTAVEFNELHAGHGRWQSSSISS